MSSKTPTARPSQITKPSLRNNPALKNTNANGHVFMVNSDIMIGHQESLSDDDDDEGTLSSSGDHAKGARVPPVATRNPRQQSSYPVRRDERDRQRHAPPLSPNVMPSFSLDTYRPIQQAVTTQDTPQSQPLYPQQQYQQQPRHGQSRNHHDNDRQQGHSPAAQPEMRERGWDQQQPQSPTRSYPLTSVSTNMTSGTAPESSMVAVSRSTSKQGRVTKYRSEGQTVGDGRSGRATRDSMERGSISSMEYQTNNNNLPARGSKSRDRFSVFLGHLTPSNRPNKYGSRLTADTPESQSAAGSKNNLIRDNLSGDMESEKQPVAEDHGSKRKTGIPGKNGQEPETDMFNFVDIMLNMPKKPTWGQVVVKLAKVLVVMSVAYFGLMALYFAAEFQHQLYMKNLDVLVVDLDQAMIGVNFINFTQQLNTEPGQINWLSQPATLYPNMSVIEEAVRSGSFWGAVVVQANASANLNKAFSIPLPDYDPSKAFAFIYDGGRDPLVVKPYIVANMYMQFLQFSKFFNPAWIKFILAYSQEKPLNISALQTAPQVMGTPVAFQEFDLHPITASIIGSATTVAYIWIFLIAGGSTYLVAHVIQPMTRHMSVFKTMVLLGAPLLVFLSTLSLAYSLLLLTFGVPFSGVTQFALLFGGMLLLQCAVAAMVLFLIYLIPVVFIPGFTITFVIMNVIAVFNPVELMPKFYRWTYAMPFLNAVQIARYVLMGSYNRLHYNIPILAAWILIPVVLLPFAIGRQKRVAKAIQLQEEEERYEQEIRERQEKLRLRLSRQQQMNGDEEDGRQLGLEDLDDSNEVKGDANRQHMVDRTRSRGRHATGAVRRNPSVNQIRVVMNNLDTRRTDDDETRGEGSQDEEVDKSRQRNQGRQRYDGRSSQAPSGSDSHTRRSQSQSRRRQDGTSIPREIK